MNNRVQFHATPRTVTHQAPLTSIYGIFQARILEWVAFPTPGNGPNPGIDLYLWHLLHWLVNSLPLAPPGKPQTPFSSVQFSRSVMSDSLQPYGLQHTRPP